MYSSASSVVSGLLPESPRPKFDSSKFISWTFPPSITFATTYEYSSATSSSVLTHELKIPEFFPRIIMRIRLIAVKGLECSLGSLLLTWEKKFSREYQRTASIDLGKYRNISSNLKKKIFNK
jgi:hypothetical protein